MADKTIKIAVVLSAYDKMTAGISQAVTRSVSRLKALSDKTEALSKSAFAFGKETGGIGLATAGLLAGPLKAAADMEKLRVALKTALGGNIGETEKAFKVINDFAARTPYGLEEVMSGFIKLKNMGLDPSNKALQSYGNTASAMGKSLNDMIEAITDATTGEFERLKEFGIKASSTKDKVTFLFRGVKTTIAKDAASIEKYLQGIGDTYFAGGIEEQSKTVYGQLSTLQDNFKVAAATLGKTLIPAVNELFKRVTPLLDKLQSWIEKNPELTQKIMLGVAAFAALNLGISGASFAFGGVMKIVSVGTKVFQGLTSTLGFVSKAVLFIGRLFLANPMLLAIAAIATAAFLIYKYWDQIKAFFIRLWNNVTKLFRQAWETIKALFLNYTPYGLIIQHWDKITAWFGSLWNKVKAVFKIGWEAIKYLFFNYTPHGLIIKHWDRIRVWFTTLWTNVKAIFRAAWEGIKNLFLNYTPQGLVIKHWSSITAWFGNLWERVKGIFNGFTGWLFGLGTTFWNAGKNIIESIWKGIKAVVNKPIEAIREMVGKIRDYLPFSPAKTGALKDIHRIRLIETIAQSIKAGPLINAISRVTEQVFHFKGQPFSPVPAYANGQPGNVTLHFAPVIHLSGGATTKDANILTAEMKRQFDKMMKDYEARIRRIKF